MTDKELLNQALEYLEDNQHWVADGDRHAYVMEYNAFIDKLKQALAQPTSGDYALGYAEGFNDACKKPSQQDTVQRLNALVRAQQITIDKLKAQPEQEPVAWMHEWDDGEKIPMLQGRDDRDQDKPITVRPLVYGDTTPPQRKPLTDERLDEIESQILQEGGSYSDVLRAVADEAAHGIQE